MQNNMEFSQASSGLEGTHVEHGVLTCVLQYLVSGNRNVVLQFGSKLFYPRFSRQSRSTSHGEELTYMYCCNMWNSMFQHVQCNIWPCEQAIRDIVWCKFSNWISIRFTANLLAMCG